MSEETNPHRQPAAATPDRSGPLRPTGQAPVPLSELVAAVQEGPQAPDMRLRGEDAGQQVSGITLDSRSVAPGDVYVALPGSRTHGIAFADKAVAGGALAVLTDTHGLDNAPPLTDQHGREVPVVAVASPRTVMAHWADRIYAHPSGALQMFGITGTNGKTTTAVLLAAALSAAGKRAGTIGTLGFRVGDRALATDRTTVTTPESVDLHGLLAVMGQEGAQAVAMEVSSHAMVFARAEAVHFDVVAFTNLGRDHLDFHPTMEDYFEAKASLFTPEHARAAVISIDDEWGAALAPRARARMESVRTTSFTDPEADWFAHDVTPLPGGGSRVSVRSPLGELTFDVGLPGLFNARNAVTVAAMLAEAGIDLDTALPGLADAEAPGRMQTIALPPTAAGAPAPLAVVDFAHTPQAVASALTALAERRDAAAAQEGPNGAEQDPAGAAQGSGGGAPRLIAVLGCGGDRDADKRAPMGAAAAQHADVVFVTDDNPRSEEPTAIRAQVLAGAREEAARSGAVVHDGGGRADALRSALHSAGPRDIIAVLGKGHEQGQIVGDRTIPFDDATQLRTAWADLHPPRPT